MSNHLEKARAALAAAAEIANKTDLLDEQEIRSRTNYHQLLDVAGIQAQLAQADALERIADVLFNRAVYVEVRR